MSLWTFDLRSNDSDVEDDENDLQNTALSRSQQSTRQKQMDQELMELFGTTEESVEYKPNPWSIAKINAHSRNTGPVIKSKSKAAWKPASNSSPRSIGLERFWKNPKSIVKDGRVISSDTGIHQSPKVGKSLRDSISDALRRGGPVATNQDQDTPTRARIHEVGGLTNRLEPQLNDITLSPNTRQPLDTSIPPPRFHQPTSQVFALNEFRAYTPDGHSRIPIIGESPREAEDIQRRDASNQLFPDNAYPFGKRALPVRSGDQFTLDDSLRLPSYPVDDEEALSDEFLHTPVDLRSGLQWEDTFNEHTPNRLITPSPEHEPQWISQNQAPLASPYSDSPRTNKLEPSPTVQLIAQFAAPKLDKAVAVSKRSEYSDPDVYRAESPVFTRSPPSPTPQHTQTSRQTYQPHTPNRPSYLAQNALSTPPRKTIAHQFDPDDKPFWSTLPTPPSSKLKPPTNGIKTSRFRLPGAFLAGGTSGRTLYKPPPRKRTRSRGDEELGTRWKVTRVG
ncbi:unnamed protein product [Rhizoctonia solani]|uniref:Uncharacterized protein n=1 Tax=Rhizoctonia solani TaxID=456999 RepID=A0A8H2WZQ4_9AGAM|nr:unnamed protein product [Rhizoctonia solani]